MKQQITREQLDELSEHALRKYADYAVIKELYITNPIKTMPNEDGTFTEMVEPARLRLMTIGMMIEFLGDTWFYELGKIWGKNHSNLYYEEGVFTNTDLCDALWEATKGVLEK